MTTDQLAVFHRARDAANSSLCLSPAAPSIRGFDTVPPETSRAMHAAGVYSQLVAPYVGESRAAVSAVDVEAFLMPAGTSFLVVAVPPAMADPPDSVWGAFFGAVLLLSGLAILRTKLR
jgi:hypothetical protein